MPPAPKPTLAYWPQYASPWWFGAHRATPLALAEEATRGPEGRPPCLLANNGGNPLPLADDVTTCHLWLATCHLWLATCHLWLATYHLCLATCHLCRMSPVRLSPVTCACAKAVPRKFLSRGTSAISGGPLCGEPHSRFPLPRGTTQLHRVAPTRMGSVPMSPGTFPPVTSTGDKLGMTPGL